MLKFKETLTNVSSDQLNSKICFATDDFFEVAEFLLKSSPPVFDPNTFTVNGKQMDGWETRRKRTAGHDFCIVKLGLSAEIKMVHVDTAFFTGNHPPHISIQAATLEDDPKYDNLVRTSVQGSKCTSENLELAEKLYNSSSWTTIVPTTSLNPGYPDERHHYFTVSDTSRYTHIRLNLYPDGGIARLGVYGIVSKNWNVVDDKTLLDLLAVENGGRCVDLSNAHYGHPKNLCMHGRGKRMDDGWETARNIDRPLVYLVGDDGHLIIPGSHWCILKLGKRAKKIAKIEVDTAHFKGNFPESCIVEGTDDEETAGASWFPILDRKKLQADKQHYYDVQVNKPVRYVRLTMYPDGGISRLRVWGYI